ncbi:MAG: hypothetical protein O2856_00295 [Planctomycetota bacterium]|nr:hypothetical protein [Planctomycetota bacterium]
MSKACTLMVAILFLGVVSARTLAQEAGGRVLPGTELLTMESDIASQLVDGVDRFLLRELESSVGRRKEHWQRDFSSHAAYLQSVAKNRSSFAHQLGVRDSRVAETEPRLLSTLHRSSLVGRGDHYEIHAVRWAAFGDVEARGLLLEPKDVPILAQVVAIPDCGVLPEQLVGLMPGVPAEAQYARRLAENGCRVLVPLLVNRQERFPQLSHREWLYRSAFELGRGLVAYEVQEVLAAVDWFSRNDGKDAPIGVFGWGEGGLISLYAGALDVRINATGVSGYFDSRQNIWNEPIDRNVFGLLEQFGDAELASLIAPRALIVEACAAAVAEIPGGRGAPAKVVTPDVVRVRAEVARARELTAGLDPSATITLVESGEGHGQPGCSEALVAFLTKLGAPQPRTETGKAPGNLLGPFDPAPRHNDLVHQLNRHSQFLLSESHYVRQTETMASLISHPWKLTKKQPRRCGTFSTTK